MDGIIKVKKCLLGEFSHIAAAYYGKGQKILLKLIRYPIKRAHCIEAIIPEIGITEMGSVMMLFKVLGCGTRGNPSMYRSGWCRSENDRVFAACCAGSYSLQLRRCYELPCQSYAGCFFLFFIPRKENSS